MIRPQLEGDEARPDSVTNHIINNGLGKIRVLDAAPTSTGNSVPEGELGYFNLKIYATIAGTLYEWAVTAT